MSLRRNKRPKSKTSIGFKQTQLCPKSTGLVQKLSSIFAREAFVYGKSTNFPIKIWLILSLSDEKAIVSRPTNSSRMPPRHQIQRKKRKL